MEKRLAILWGPFYPVSERVPSPPAAHGFIKEFNLSRAVLELLAGITGITLRAKPPF